MAVISVKNKPTSEPNLSEIELLNLEKTKREIDPRQKRTEKENNKTKISFGTGNLSQ